MRKNVTSSNHFISLRFSFLLLPSPCWERLIVAIFLPHSHFPLSDPSDQIELSSESNTDCNPPRAYFLSSWCLLSNFPPFLLRLNFPFFLFSFLCDTAISFAAEHFRDRCLSFRIQCNAVIIDFGYLMDVALRY